MRQSKRVVLIATAVTAIVVAACGGAAPPPPDPASPPPAAAEYSVSATEFAFDPGEFEVPAGSEVNITLVNGGTIEHDFVIDALDLVVHANVGETVSGTVTIPAGTYDFYCSIPGHKQAGMVGTLTAN